MMWLLNCSVLQHKNQFNTTNIVRLITLSSASVSIIIWVFGIHNIWHCCKPASKVDISNLMRFKWRTWSDLIEFIRVQNIAAHLNLLFHSFCCNDLVEFVVFIYSSIHKATETNKIKKRSCNSCQRLQKHCFTKTEQCVAHYRSILNTNLTRFICYTLYRQHSFFATLYRCHAVSQMHE